MRQLPTQGERVETGPVRFGEDWPGLFVRGDEARTFAENIEQILSLVEKHEGRSFDGSFAAHLARLLRSTRVEPT